MHGDGPQGPCRDPSDSADGPVRHRLRCPGEPLSEHRSAHVSTAPPSQSCSCEAHISQRRKTRCPSNCDGRDPVRGSWLRLPPSMRRGYDGNTRKIAVDRRWPWLTARYESQLGCDGGLELRHSRRS
jgi:hypothetical protein